MKTKRLILGLFLINLGVFIATAAWLPRPPSFGWSGPISRMINSRDRWEIAWFVTLGSSLASTGAVVLLRKDN
jgi:hypothetical protein